MKKYIISLLLLIAMILFTAACATDSKDEDSQGSDLGSDEITVTGKDENKSENNSGGDMTQTETPVIMEMNGTEVKAVLNNTLTAREFIKLLPYSVTVSRAADDLCGSVRENLPSDDSEGKNSWKIGEIGWFGGWFTILVDHEEKFSKMPGVMIIGKVDDEYMDIVKGFSGRVDISVRLAD